MATCYSQSSGVWSEAARWNTAADGSGVSGAPIDGDAVVVQAGHVVTVDVDLSAWTTGIAGLVVQGGATPGQLSFKNDADGVYALNLKAATNLSGTTAGGNRGRLFLAGGNWASPSDLPFGRKARIEFLGATAGKLLATDLDVVARCTEPTNRSVRTYRSLKVVSSIDTSTDTVTMDSVHGWANNTPVTVRSTGTIPAPLQAGMFYYVRNQSGATLQLSLTSGGAAVDLTGASWTGTLELYDGHTDTGTAVINVLDDVTGDPQWAVGAAVVLADPGMAQYDQQRLTIAGVAAGAITLSANVDSAQYPGARIWLVERNVALRTNTTNATQPLLDWGAATFCGASVGCEIRNKAGTGLFFYGSGVAGGCGNTLSGPISGFSVGTSGGVGNIVSGLVVGCSLGISSGVGLTVSGTVTGCNSGIYTCTGSMITGPVYGCTYCFNQCAGCSSNGLVSGATTGFHLCTGTTVLGSVFGCVNGVNGGSAILRGATFYANTFDLTGCQASGYASNLQSATQVSNYLFGVLGDNPIGVQMTDLKDPAGTEQPGYIGVWTSGGYTKTAAWSEALHGTPPVTTSSVNVTTLQDSRAPSWVETPILGIAGQQITVTCYAKKSANTFDVLPRVGLITKNAAPGSEELAGASMANNTAWQTLTVTYTPTYTRPLWVRVSATDGDTSGTGSETLTWFLTIASGGTTLIVVED